MTFLKNQNITPLNSIPFLAIAHKSWKIFILFVSTSLKTKKGKGRLR